MMEFLLYVAAYLSGALLVLGVYLGEDGRKHYAEAALFMSLRPIWSLIWIGMKIGRWAQ